MYLKEQAYERLREKIINCEYKPGEIINESRIIGELEMSRTPVREALNVLATEKLIMIVPKKGILVKDISINDIVQVYDARIVVEPELMVLYGNSFDRQSLREYIRKSGEVTELADIIRLDEEFHNMVYSVCKNTYLYDLLTLLKGHNHRNRIWQSNATRVQESSQEHIAIVQALLDGNYGLAKERMREHLVNARTYAIQKYLK